MTTKSAQLHRELTAVVAATTARLRRRCLRANPSSIEKSETLWEQVMRGRRVEQQKNRKPLYSGKAAGGRGGEGKWFPGPPNLEINVCLLFRGLFCVVQALRAPQWAEALATGGCTLTGRRVAALLGGSALRKCEALRRARAVYRIGPHPAGRRVVGSEVRPSAPVRSH